MIQLNFRLNLQSDYHVSAGKRADQTVDSALLRDFDDAPVLRGTLLAGLLRDGLRDLLKLQATNRITENGWDAPAFERLFGSVERRKRWACSSARAVELIESAENSWGGMSTARIRINPRTRRASDQQLFFQEEGDKRLCFDFTLSCAGMSALDQADAWLLVAASRMVRHIGSARRRGRGACRIELTSVDGITKPDDASEWTAYAVEQFRADWLESDSLPVADVEQYVKVAPPPSEEKTIRLRMIARSAEPILIAKRSQAANKLETRDIIPGTALIGAFASRAADVMGLGKTDDAPPLFRELFVRGALRTTGLYPARPEGARLYPALPAPRSLAQCATYPYFTSVEESAGPSHPLIDGLKQAVPEGCQHKTPTGICNSKLKAPRTLLTLEQSPYAFAPKTREEMHISIDPETGRVESGNLFEYTTLEANQWFVGELICDRSHWGDLQKLAALSTSQYNQLRVGKAAQRGHGLVHFVLEEITPDEAPLLVRQPMASRVNFDEQTPLDLTIMLLTDTIVSDPWGRFVNGFVDAQSSTEAPFRSQWLADWFGVDSAELEIVSRDGLPLQFVANERVDSFNSHRRMPRWRDHALQAGSVCRIILSPAAQIKLIDGIKDTTQTNEDRLLAALAQLEQKAVGLRQHEGFGRIGINHPLLATVTPGIPAIRAANALKTLPKLTRSLSDSSSMVLRWQDKLNASQQSKGAAWDAISAEFDAVARLIDLHRYRPIDELQTWLKLDKSKPLHLAQTDKLWGNKTFPARSNDPRITGPALDMIRGLVDTIADQTSDPAEQALALGLLADRISEVVESKRNRGKQGGSA